MGAEPGHSLLKEHMRRVEDNFRGDGELVYDPGIRAFNDLLWYTNKEAHGIKIYEPEYFFPIDPFSKQLTITEKTRIIHHFAGTWYAKK